MQLSDIDIAKLEAELETDLATRIYQREDAQSSLELDSLRESISNKDDDDDQHQSFSLLASARASIHSMQQEASGLVQSINGELLESRNDTTHNPATNSEVAQCEHNDQDDKVEHNAQEQEDTIFSLTQIPSSTTNDDVVDQSESDASSVIDVCVADTATNDCCETNAAVCREYLEPTTSVVDESFEQALTEANDQLRMIEEKHRMKRLILEQRKEHIRRNRNAKKLQRLWKRTIARRKLLLSSIISSLTSNTVQSAVEVGLFQCTKVLESTIDCSNRLVLRSTTELSIPQTRQMMNWNDLNCRHIMVVRDPANYKVHIFIFYQRHLKHYVVHLRRRLTDEVVKTSSALLLRYSDDSETRFSQFTRQTLPIHNLGVQPLLLPNLLSPPLMIENGPTALDLTDKSSLCLILCQMTQRVMTRRALHALQCLKATVQIQSIYRGFVVRRRLESIQCTAFDYIDSEIDDILGDNSKDMLQFDEEELGEKEVSWNPCRPYIEPNVHCSIVDDNQSSTGEADATIPTPESEPLHNRVLSSTSHTQHDVESEDTIIRRKTTTSKIVRRDHLKKKKQESNTLTWQNMKVKDIRVAQVSKSYVCYLVL